MADDQQTQSKAATEENPRESNPNGGGPQNSGQEQGSGADRQAPTNNPPQAGGDKGREGGSKKKPIDPRKKRTIRLVALAVLVVALIVAIPIYAYYSVRESTDDAQVDGHVVPVSARISGTIISVLVNDNEVVRAGQELVRLDPADYQVAADQAAANVANADASIVESKVNLPVTNINTRSQVSTSSTQTQESRAGVAAAEQGVNAARARVSSADAALQQARANNVKSQRDLERYKDLVTKDEISHQDYDAAVAAADASAAQVESAKASVLEAQHTLDQSAAQLSQAKARLATALVQERQSREIRPQQIAVSEARLKSAQAQVKQRQADLDQAKLNLGYTILRASIDGVVSRKSAEPGMQVSAGQQLMALVPLDDIWITANFKETQLRKMRVGQKAQIEIDTFGSGHKMMGHVDSIAAASGARFSLLPPENATGNFVKVVQRIPVKIVLEPGENRDRLLRPGMSVVPTVLLNSGTNNAY